MLEGLRRAITNLAAGVSKRIGDKVVYKQIKEDDIEDILDEFLLELVENEVAYDVAETIVRSVKDRLVGTQIRRGESIERVVKDAIKDVILDVLGEEAPGLDSKAIDSCRPGSPYIIVFVGVNGVGKTTTIAKVAYLIKRRGYTPLLAAADTFRAGAQEQLEIHADRLAVPIIRGRYRSDPASVGYDAIEHAKAKGFCAVLIDTAGRMHVDRDLMEELRKIIRVTKPHEVILVVDALTGNDAVEQARLFDEQVGITGTIITKVDSDVKGGVTISVAAVTKKPIIYLGTGQKYEDLVKFKPREFVERLIG